jgi:O-antigen/teichoic acid export membrane protein
MSGRTTEAGAPLGDARSFASNTIWTLLAEIIGKVASFILVVLIARSLGRVEYGVFAFILAFVPLFTIFGKTGLNTAVVQRLAKHPERLPDMLSSGLAARIGVGAVGLVIGLVVGSFLVTQPEAREVLVVLGVALLLDEISSYLGAVLKAFDRMKLYAIGTLVNRAVSTTLAAVVLALGGSLLTVSVAYLGGSIAEVVVGSLMVRRVLRPGRLRRPDRSVMDELVRRAIPLGIAGVIGLALFRIDTVMLQAIRGPAEVGLYGVAYRFLDSFLFVTYAIAGVTLPRMVREAATGRGVRTLEISVSLQLAFYLPIAVGAFFTARWVVATMFGPDYTSAAVAVVWLTAAGVFYATAHTIRAALIALDRRREVAFIAGAALAVNVGVNLYTIPAHGFVGAAVATLIAEILECGLLGWLLVRSNGVPSLRPAAAPVAAVFAMAAFLWATGWSGTAAVAAGAVVYVAALALSVRLIAPDIIKRAFTGPSLPTRDADVRRLDRAAAR